LNSTLFDRRRASEKSRGEAFPRFDHALRTARPPQAA